MEVNSYIPHPALQEHVIGISTVNATLPPGITEVITPYPPTPFQSILFYCNDVVCMGRADGAYHEQPPAVLIGPQYSRVNIMVHNRLRAIRVDFFPGGLHRLLGISMHELFDKGFDAYDFFGAQMLQINSRLQNVDALETGKQIVEDFLLSKIKNLKPLLPFDVAMKLMLSQHGNLSIEKLAALSCQSLKQFERVCKERIGMNPKMYSRILRFSKAYRLHETMPGLSWTNIAHEAGYYDQMHMIKDFRVFAGVNPTVIEKELHATPLRMQQHLSY